MKYALGTMLLLASCRAHDGKDSMPVSHTPTTTTTESSAVETTTENRPETEVEAHIRVATNRRGEGPNIREAAASAEWLLAHADKSFPVALAQAQAVPGPSKVQLVGRFKRPEATPFLSGVLMEGGVSVREAGIALGISPDPAAKAALLQGLRSNNTEVIASVVDGLRVRGDRSVCGDLKPFLEHPDAEVRELCVNTGATLRCLDRAALQRIASHDINANVRKLAADLASRP